MAERREKIVVGVNDFVQADDPPISILYIDESAAETQLAKLERIWSGLTVMRMICSCEPGW